MAEAANGKEPFILFAIKDTVFGVRSREVRHIEMVEQITPVPNAARFIDGVVFTRGQVVPAVNLRARFGLDRVPYDLRTRFLVLQAEDRVLGLIVDECREFVSLDQGAILPPPEEIAGQSGKFLEGIVRQADRLILILNVAEIIKHSGAEELAGLADIPAALKKTLTAGETSALRDAPAHA
jgi:purine-binding chemotaxis protein CheW